MRWWRPCGATSKARTSRTTLPCSQLNGSVLESGQQRVVLSALTPAVIGHRPRRLRLGGVLRRRRALAVRLPSRLWLGLRRRGRRRIGLALLLLILLLRLALLGQRMRRVLLELRLV